MFGVVERNIGCILNLFQKPQSTICLQTTSYGWSLQDSRQLASKPVHHNNELLDAVLFLRSVVCIRTQTAEQRFSTKRHDVNQKRTFSEFVLKSLTGKQITIMNDVMTWPLHFLLRFIQQTYVLKVSSSILFKWRQICFCRLHINAWSLFTF